MPKFHGIAGPDSTPVYPSVRKIGPADLKDALAKGVEDFLTMPSSLVFLGLIYPIVGIGLVAGSSLPLLFPLMSGFALVGPFATIGLYEISRRRELGLDTSWAHAFGVSRSHSIFSILSLGLLLLAIFACWEFTAQSLYVALFGSTPPEFFIQFVANILGTPQGWQLIGFGTAIGFVFAVVALSISVVSFPLLLDRDVDVPVAISRLTKATGRQNAAATGAALPSDLAPLPRNRLDALALARHYQAQAIISQWAGPVRMPDHTHKSFDISRKSRPAVVRRSEIYPSIPPADDRIHRIVDSQRRWPATF